MRMFKLFLIALSAVLIAEFGAGTAASAQDAEQKTYKFAVTDVVGLEELQREFAKLNQELSRLTGLKIKLYPVTNRTAVVESLRSKRLDFALSGPAEYVVARKRAQVIPLVGLSRPGYRSVIIAHKDSGIRSIADLKGKKVAFGDFGSTSYHLAPMQLIKDSGLDPKTDIQGVNVAKQVAWQSFVKKRVDAIGMSELRFQQYCDSEPDLSMDSLVVLASTPLLPGDVILAGSHVPDDVQKKVRDAFVSNSESLMSAILTGERNQKYLDMTFVGSVHDSDYDYIRSMYATAGYDEYSLPESG